MRRYRRGLQVGLLMVIAAFIASLFVFGQRGFGGFALKRYQEYVRRRGLAAAAFENEMRRELTRMKVEQAVRGGVKVTPAEVEHAFVLRREEARAAWALVEFGPLIAAASASD